MREILELQVRATAQDEKLVQDSLDRIMGVFKNYLEVVKRTNQLTTREFYMLYYDLHYFLKHDLQKRKSYSVKDIKSFSISFRLIFEKLEKVIYRSEAYLSLVFEELSEVYLNWLNEVTEANFTGGR